MDFFLKHKTACESRISDWSSDVCSTDLREALADPNMPSEVATVPRVLDLASERLSCPSFSLRLGQRQNMLNLFGSLSLVIRSATTIDEFVRNLVDFFPLHTRGAILSLSRAEDGMQTGRAHV